MLTHILSHAQSQKKQRRIFRRFAPYVVGVFAWSAFVGPAAPGLGLIPSPLPAMAGAVRSISSLLAGLFIAAPLHQPSLTPASGSTYPWEGNIAGTNTGNGNKLTSVPLVGWTAKGGLPVQLTLYHNSQGTHNSELGHKWTYSYDLYGALCVNMS
jgi:hypothetical protein